jgi:hypothetical protein
MKSLALLLLIAGVALARADSDLLQNGDFSHGLAHWYGNIQALPDAADGTPVPGVMIKLRSSEWTTLTQDFEVKAGAYKLQATFTLSPNAHFSNQLTDYINIPVKLSFPDEHPLDAQPGQWVAVVTDPTAGTSLCWMVDCSRKPGQQTYTFTVKDINFSNKQTLLLAFPPGSATVTLQRVSLVPPDSH